MNKTMKYILGGVAIVIVVLVVVVGGVLNNLDGIVEEVIESVGSDVVGTEVAVTGVGISLTEGSATIDGLTLANPSGFDAANAFSLNGISVGIDIASITKNPIVINSITIDNPEVWFETNEKGESNLDQILAGISSGDEAEQPTTESGDPMMLSIKSFSFTGGSLHANDKVSGKQIDANLPAISLSNIGGNSGTTAGEVASEIVNKLVSESISAALSQGLQQAVEKEIEEGIKGKMEEGLKGLFDRN
jgi:uncharacterized protein involved in outer membrane biogenesis